MDETKLKEDV